MKRVLFVSVGVPLLCIAYLLVTSGDDFTVPPPDADSTAPFEVPPPGSASIIAIPIEADLSGMLAEAKAEIASPVAQASEIVNLPTNVHLQLFATRVVRQEVEKLESKIVEETRRECDRSERRCAHFERRVEKICRDVPWPLNEVCDVVDSAVCIAHETTCVAWKTVVIGTRVVQVPIKVIEDVEEEFVEIIDKITDLDAELDYTVNFVDLDANMDGQTIRGFVDVDYKIKLNARLNALEGKIKLAEVNGLTNCGYDEPMRRLRMHFSVDLITLAGAAFELGNPRWSLAWPNACQLTAFDVQLEDLLGLSVVKDAVQKAIDRALDKALNQANGSLRFQDRLAEIWPDIHAPVELDGAGWIAINPERLWIAPIFGSGKSLRTIATVSALPVLSDTEPTPVGPAIAPPAGLGNRRPEIALRIAAGVSYATVIEQIKAALADIAPDFVTIADIKAYSSYGRLVLGLQIAAPVRGTLYLIGTPHLDSETRVSFSDVDYTIDSSNALLAIAGKLFHDRLLSLLRKVVVLDFTGERKAALEAYGQREFPIGAAGTLSLSLETAAMDEIRIMEQGIYALMRLQGAADARLAP